jgi:uncharacterized protein (TIGR02217 family)
MAELAIELPNSIEIGATKRLEWIPEIVTSDGGKEVRNQRTSRAKRYYDIAFPTCTRDNAAYLAVLQLFEESMGGNDSFWITDWTDESGETKVKVRFDGELQISSPAGHLDHIDTFTLVEVFD